jgi:hypothetical protein
MQKLIARVAANGYDTANAAVDALVGLGPVAARPMADALAGMEHNGRWVMLLGLARMGTPAMAALCATLPSADNELKLTVCQALGGTYHRADIPHKPSEPLLLLLSDPDPQVRRYAASALDSLKWTPSDDRELALMQAAR